MDNNSNPPIAIRLRPPNFLESITQATIKVAIISEVYAKSKGQKAVVTSAKRNGMSTKVPTL